MPVAIRDNIHSDIASQFPDVYKENSQFLISFVEAYYKHLDEKMDRDIPKLRDIDTTLTSFMVYYKNKHLIDLPIQTDPAVDIRFIIKHIDDLYTRKGSQESLELLFRIFFNEDIEVVYPSSSILKPSDSIWGGEEFLEMTTVYDVNAYPIKRGNTITGDLTLASAFVDDIVFVNFSGALTPVVYLSNLKGRFSSDDALEVLGADSDGNTTITNVGKLISGSLSSITINDGNRLPGQNVGDIVEFRSRKDGTGGKGIVSEVSGVQIGSINYKIIDGGFGYIVPGSTSVTVQDVGISNQVIIVEEEITIPIQAGDTIVFPGSTVTYDGQETYTNDRPATQYSVTGSATVIDYQHPLLYIETKVDKTGLFEFLGETWNYNGVTLRNLLYDSFFNSYQLSQGQSPTFDTPSLSLTKIINQESSYGSGVIGNFTGTTGIGDLSSIDKNIRISDINIMSSYLLAINNDVDDGNGDNDQWLATSDATMNLAGGGAQSGTDVIDRTPTISPVIPVTAEFGFDSNLGLSELDNGQLYTIVNPGTNLTASDWAKIGATKGIAGEDFIFTNSKLSELNTNVIDLSSGVVVPSTLTRFDAIFSPIKQVYGRWFKYLAHNSVLPKLTIGTSYATPPSDDYAHRSVYNLSVKDLVAGREYIVSDMGTTSYADWVSVGLDFTNITDFDLDVDSLVPGRTYIIKDPGTTTLQHWADVGVTGTDFTQGVKFQATNPQPTVTGTGKVIDVSAVHANGGQNTPVSFNAANPMPDSVTGTGICLDVPNILGGRDGVSNNHKYFTSGGVFGDPLISGSNEQRVLPSEAGATTKFFGFLNGDYSKPVKCSKMGALNESSNFNITGISNKETVSIIRDQIGDYYRELIDPSTPDANNRYGDAEYEMTGILNGGLQNIDTPFGEAFTKITFDIGTISEINNDQPGNNYENDTHVRVINEEIARFDKKDVIVNFELADFTLEPNEMIVQEIVLPSEAIDSVNDLSIDDVAGLGISTTQVSDAVPYGNSVTTFAIETQKYQSKHRFLKQLGRDYYFRPMSFYGFDTSVPVNIRSVDKSISMVRKDETSQPMGANANILGSASFSTGQILDTKITHTGYKYDDNAIVDIINLNSSSDSYNQVIATGTIRTLGMGNTGGRWKTNSSFLGYTSGQRLHDNDYYQEYSYDISSIVDPGLYTPLVKDTVGVVGTKMFNTSLINSNSDIDSDLSVEINFFDVNTETLLAQGFIEDTNVPVAGTEYQLASDGVVSVNPDNPDPFTNIAVNDIVKVSGAATHETTKAVVPLDYYKVIAVASDDTFFKLGDYAEGEELSFTEGFLAGYVFEKITITSIDNEPFETNQGDDGGVSEIIKVSTVSESGSIIQ